MLDIMLQIQAGRYMSYHRHHAVNIKHHVWLQVMRWLASTIPNALGTVAEVDNEVDLEEDDASDVSS